MYYVIFSDCHNSGVVKLQCARFDDAKQMVERMREMCCGLYDISVEDWGGKTLIRYDWSGGWVRTI